MSERGNLPIETADQTIRNLRYRAWPGFATLLGLIVVVGAIEFALQRRMNRWQQDVYYLAIGLVVFVALFCLGVRLPLLRPVRQLKLGKSLQIYGGGAGRWPPEEVQWIEFGPDPAEDYVDEELPIPMVKVTLALWPVIRRRLFVSAGDAARLREWAAGKGIAVNDPGGHSIPRSVP